MIPRERKVNYYGTAWGDFPFGDWRRSLDNTVRCTVDSRIRRFRMGNFGVFAPVGEGISEAKIDLGPGYRIYYGIHEQNIVLLCGGNKKTQRADIARAKAYWVDHKERADAKSKTK